MTQKPLQAARPPTNTPQAIAQDPGRTIAALLQGQKKQIALALPRHMTPDRMLRIALTELRRTPALQRCEPLSFLGAVIVCAQIGLEPGNALGHVYLIPYGKECKVVIGYRGMIELARRSGQIVSIGAYPVYDKDDFHFEFGLEPTIKHRPSNDAEPGPLAYVYAVAKLKDGGTQFEVMTRAQVEAIKARAKAGNSGPWVTDFDEMGRKTVIRRLWKYLPVSVEMARAADVLQAEDEEQALDIANYETGEPISLEPAQTVATSAEVQAHKRNEALETAWHDVLEAGGRPEDIVKMTEAQVNEAPASKQETVIVILREWIKAKKGPA